jgi:hypothetical protein
MATGAEVLQMLIPDGGYVISGNDYSGITFIEAEPITKEEFDAGFAQVDAFQAQQAAQAATARAALLNKLGITEDEARLLLGGN